MSKQDFLNILPLFILTSASILILFSIALRRNHKFIYVITVLCLLADFIFLHEVDIESTWMIEPLFIFDGFGKFNVGLILLASLASPCCHTPTSSSGRSARKNTIYY